MFNNLFNRPATAFMLTLLLSATLILAHATPDFIQEMNRHTATVLILAYTGLILGYRAIYISLKK